MTSLWKPQSISEIARPKLCLLFVFFREDFDRQWTFPAVDVDIAFEGESDWRLSCWNNFHELRLYIRPEKCLHLALRPLEPYKLEAVSKRRMNELILTAEFSLLLIADHFFIRLGAFLIVHVWLFPFELVAQFAVVKINSLLPKRLVEVFIHLDCVWYNLWSRQRWCGLIPECQVDNLLSWKVLKSCYW